MKPEKEQVQLKSFTLTPSPQGGMLTIASSGKSFHLNSIQYSYLDVLKNGNSIESLVQFFLGQGWLVNFRELYSLLQFLLQEDVIQNASLKNAFAAAAASANLSESSLSAGTHIQYQKKDLPFFRSLDPALADHLLQKATTHKVAANTRITKSGDTSRDLFILLKGQASIYKVFDQNRRQLVSTIGNMALFGERGFLLNQPRTADIITTTECEVLRIPHLPEFDEMIKSDKAQSLQHRFWVLQALHSSGFFKNLPGDSIDSLIFSGKLCKAPANQVLFKEGQVGNTCYILIQGNVVISQNGQNLRVMTQGSCFGEIALMMSGGRRTATVTTQLDSILLEIQQNDFYRILAQNIVLAKEIETLAAERLQNTAVGTK